MSGAYGHDFITPSEPDPIDMMEHDIKTLTHERDEARFERDAATREHTKALVAATKLSVEVERLRALGQEFIWGEDNPHEYESEMTKLKAENERLREALRGLYNHTKNDQCVHGLNAAARAALAATQEDGS